MHRPLKLLHPDDYSDEDNQKAKFEQYLEDSLVSNFNAVFEGKYELLARQYPIIERGETIGQIDVLALNTQTNSLTAIELKRDIANRDVCGQIMAYMGWLKFHRGQLIQEFKALQNGHEHDDIEGIIICGSPDIRLYLASAIQGNLSLYGYGYDTVMQVMGLTKYIKIDGNNGLNLKLPENFLKQESLITELDDIYNKNNIKALVK